MGALLSTLAGHHSGGEVAEEALGQQKPQEAPSTSATAPSTPALAALTRVDCCLRPGQPCVKMWKCKMRQGSKKTKGVLHAFPAYICFHPRGSSSSSSITQIDLAGVDDIGITTKHAKHYVFLLTPMGRTYFRGVSGSEVKDCHLVLSTLWAGLRGHLPVAALTRSQQPSFVRASSDDLNKLQQIGRLEGEYGMRAHPELPDVMAAIFLRAKQTTDLLRAYGYSPNVPTTVNKTDTILPVSLSSFWRAFASQRWQDWPTVFLPTGRWRVKVGEWRIDGVGRSRQVVFTAKPPKNQSGTEEACVGTIAATQLACLVVNRKSLETRIHIAVVSTNNGNEYPKAKEWFELVDISRDKGFPLLQILDYRWHEEAPTPLAAPHTSA